MGSWYIAYLIKWNDCIFFCKYEEGWTLEIKPVFPLSNDTWVKGIYTVIQYIDIFSVSLPHEDATKLHITIDRDGSFNFLILKSNVVCGNTTPTETHNTDMLCTTLLLKVLQYNIHFPGKTTRLLFSLSFECNVQVHQIRTFSLLNLYFFMSVGFLSSSHCWNVDQSWDGLHGSFPTKKSGHIVLQMQNNQVRTRISEQF